MPNTSEARLWLARCCLDMWGKLKLSNAEIAQVLYKEMGKYLDAVLAEAEKRE